MSVITNEPIMLNATAQAIADELNRQNGYLSLMTSGKKSEVYSDISQIAHIVRSNELVINKQLFPIGDQIIIPWKDMDDSAHNTDETAYQVAWDIVTHRMVTLKDGSQVPGLFLQMHKCSAYGVQFSHQQAFMSCPDGLEAGTYHVTFGAKWGNNGAEAGSSWQFTLTKPVPAGGRLSGFDYIPDVATSTYTVKSWGTPDAANPIETVPVSAGEEGTALGTMMFTTLGAEGLNCMQSVGYGHNRWSTSALRQYLNSAGNNWWESKEDFDIRPDQYAKKGFMSGFGEDFLAAIKPVKVTTALNVVEGFDAATEDTYDTFFLPSLEEMNAKPQLSNAEGNFFEYWRKRMGLDKFINYSWEAEPNKSDALLIPALNVNSPQSVRLRSAGRDSASNAWYVHASGCVSNPHASYASRFSPVCVIC